LNPRPQAVIDPLFAGDAFFDARDLVQVKYEMVRRVTRDGHAVTQACAAFGLSRQAFYKAKEALAREGLAGLLPKKRGPRGGHKLTDDVVHALEAARAADPTLAPSSLVEYARRHFGLNVHPRSIQRALERRKKKRR
jgi:transposase